MMLHQHHHGAMSNLSGAPPGYVESDNQIVNTSGSAQVRLPAWLIWLVGGYIVYRLLKK